MPPNPVRTKGNIVQSKYISPADYAGQMADFLRDGDTKNFTESFAKIAPQARAKILTLPVMIDNKIFPTTLSVYMAKHHPELLVETAKKIPESSKSQLTADKPVGSKDVNIVPNAGSQMLSNILSAKKPAADLILDVMPESKRPEILSRNIDGKSVVRQLLAGQKDFAPKFKEPSIRAAAVELHNQRVIDKLAGLKVDSSYFVDLFTKGDKGLIAAMTARCHSAGDTLFGIVREFSKKQFMHFCKNATVNRVGFDNQGNSGVYQISALSKFATPQIQELTKGLNHAERTEIINHPPGPVGKSLAEATPHIASAIKTNPNDFVTTIVGNFGQYGQSFIQTPDGKISQAALTLAAPPRGRH